MTLIEEHPTDVMEWVAAVNHNNLVVCHLQDVKVMPSFSTRPPLPPNSGSLPLSPSFPPPLSQSVMSLHHLEDGRFIRNFPLGMGAVSDYSGKRHQTEMFYGFVSFLEPGTFYRCDLTSDDFTPTVTPYHSFNSFVMEPCLLCRCSGR